ncbi:MAG: hypothetical protein ACKV2O_07775 [Acidimicrobiales bacterium]
MRSVLAILRFGAGLATAYAASMMAVWAAFSWARAIDPYDMDWRFGLFFSAVPVGLYCAAGWVLAMIVGGKRARSVGEVVVYLTLAALACLPVALKYNNAAPSTSAAVHFRLTLAVAAGACLVALHRARQAADA